MKIFKENVKTLIDRPEPIQKISESFKIHPVTALLGPRQCGKTTLSRMIEKEEPATFFDLENPIDMARLSAPMQALKELSGLVIIDEIQRKPALFELLRVLVDRPGNSCRFLLLGSSSPELVKGISESLAGRIGFVDLAGFHLFETGTESLNQLWLRGGFPLSFLSGNQDESNKWREDFIRTFLERDIPQLGITIPAETLRRFWTMVAHYHANIWNGAEFARSLGTAENTARRYLDILSGAYMVRVLPPWFENIKKRQVKSPKIYIRDSGLFHSLIHILNYDYLQGHPKVGASWEGFALEQVVQSFNSRDTYFWGTHAGAELDLMLVYNGQRIGFEFKFADAPRTTRSMHIAIEDLYLSHLWIVYPGDQAYVLNDKITVIPLVKINSIKQRLQ
jgi:predicted AAA+ superfamily ATPase